MLGLGSVAAALSLLLFLIIIIIPFSSSYDHGPTPKYSFMQNATSAPPVSHHDYIIIGGGTAGCPLAATLSKTASVLLLERGGSPYNHPDITSLAAFGKHLSDPTPSSPAQPFVSEDGVVNARARVLGGGSCLNAGFYTRAEPGFARWDDGRLVNESYAWVERRVAFEPPANEWQAAVKEGLLEAGVGPDNGFTYEHRVGTKFGGTIFDGEGRRHTAADLLKDANPEGLTVLLHATVHKILFEIKGRTRPLAHGVVFRDASGIKHVAYLNIGPKNEIILSAGALGSPQLLMLSGVGPSDHLKAHNIPLVLDHPFVGKAMSDNPMNGVVVPSPIPVNVSLIQAVGITNFGSYIEAAGGQSFIVTLPTKLDFRMFYPKIGHLSKPVEALDPPVFMGGFIIQKINGPFSTGRLRLKTKNPNDNPSVSFNYFKDQRDVNKCVRGLEVMKRVVESKAFSPFRFDFLPFSLLMNMTARAPVNLRPKHANTTESFEQFCKDTVITIWHYHGGCLVGKVVDSDYKVVGVDGLRVVDGSTFRYSPGTNPQATVMMMGRYMGVKIRRERLMNDKAK